MQGTQTASLDTSKSPVWLLFSSAIPFDNFTGTPNKEPREVNFLHHCVTCCVFGVSFQLFSVKQGVRTLTTCFAARFSKWQHMINGSAPTHMVVHACHMPPHTVNPAMTE